MSFQRGKKERDTRDTRGGDKKIDPPPDTPKSRHSKDRKKHTLEAQASGPGLHMKPRVLDLFKRTLTYHDP